MLVCNVSLRAPRRGIAATIAEATTAVDATATGNIVFATLVDDPASVGDIVDAYLGEIMLEAASASDDITAGSAFVGAIDEAATADTSHDATVTSVVNSWNPADLVNTTLSSGNLTATSTAAGGVRATSVGAGKHYFELTMTTWTASTTGCGIASSTANLSTIGATPTQAAIVYRGTGNIWINNAASGSTLGARANGNIIGVAFDISANLIWFRVAPSGNWNGSGTANPATGTGGLNISALSASRFPCFASGVTGEISTANLGASAFSGSVPSGFTAGF